MNLFINSPSYYTQECGVIDEIYQMCKAISNNIDITKYTTLLDTIGITPIIAPKHLLDCGKWSEIKKISLPYRFASISLICDYELYVNSDLIYKKKIIINNILQSLLFIKKHLKNEFNYQQIEEDINNLMLDQI